MFTVNFSLERSDEMESKEYYIPQNYRGSTKLFGFIWPRNLAEAMGVTFLVEVILKEIPFVLEVKIGVMAVVGIALMWVFILGICDESIFQFLFAYFKFLISRKKLEMSPPKKGGFNDAQESNELTVDDRIDGGESNFDRIIRKITKKSQKRRTEERKTK